MVKQVLKRRKRSWFSSLKDLFTGRKVEDSPATVFKTDLSTSILEDLKDVEITIPPDVNKIEIVNELLRLGPEDYDYLYLNGECDNSTPLRRMAYKIALQAVQDLPNEPSLLSSLGFSLIELADYQKALICFLREAEKLKDDGAVWNNIAWCQMRLRRYNEALVSCEKALKFLSNHSYVHHDYASILAGLGKLDEAIAVIKNAISNIKPQAVQLHYLLATLLERKGDIQSAITIWKEYLKLVGDKTGHEKAMLRVQDKLKRHGVSISLRITRKPESDKQIILIGVCT